MDEIRILVVADDPLARSGLAVLLNTQPTCLVVGQVGSAGDLANAISVYQPQALAWDLGWEPASALDRLAELRDGGLPIVALVRDETHAADAWTAGARGLLRRDTDGEKLSATLAAVSRGLVALDPSLTGVLLPVRDRLPTPPAEDLTPRELEVLQRLAEGLPNKIIAQRLAISEHTVKFHINAILSKLGAQSRTDAVVRATRLGLIIL